MVYIYLLYGTAGGGYFKLQSGHGSERGLPKAVIYVGQSDSSKVYRKYRRIPTWSFRPTQVATCRRFEATIVLSFRDAFFRSLREIDIQTVKFWSTTFLFHRIARQRSPFTLDIEYTLFIRLSTVYSSDTPFNNTCQLVHQIPHHST